MIRFEVQFNVSNQRFEVGMSSQSYEVELRFAGNEHFETSFEAYQEVVVYKDADPYKGAYEVTPKVEAQVLPTAKKLMADDVTIKAIPIYDVSNTSGGSTVYIAREVM